MQTFELLTMIAFLTMYLGSALRAIIAPESYRQAEINFYKTGKPGVFELLAGDGGGRNTAAVVPGRVNGHATPAGAENDNKWQE